uniref:Transmembrane protein n=1 Tax=Arundo donax TaxID=35708 RepID=A0A0A9H177_ARUDO
MRCASSLLPGRSSPCARPAAFPRVVVSPSGECRDERPGDSFLPDASFASRQESRVGCGSVEELPIHASPDNPAPTASERMHHLPSLIEHGFPVCGHEQLRSGRLAFFCGIGGFGWISFPALFPAVFGCMRSWVGPAKHFVLFVLSYIWSGLSLLLASFSFMRFLNNKANYFARWLEFTGKLVIC